MKVAVELSPEDISRLVYEDLKLSLECFLEDMECENPNVFWCSPIYDRMLIQAHIDALELILEWYRDPSVD